MSFTFVCVAVFAVDPLRGLERWQINSPDKPIFLRSDQMFGCVKISGPGRVLVAGGVPLLEFSGFTGNVSFVENASSVTDFIVMTSRQIAIVPRHVPGLRIRATPGLSSPALADIHFDRVRPSCIEASPIDLERLLVIARLLLAARAFGAAQRGFEILTDYAHVRSQFGKKIGSYQAIQHKMANLLIVIETCRLALLRAGAAGVSNILADSYAASVAVAAAARGLRDAVLDIHHGFGGVSFWEDHEMPRHFRRVHGDLVRYGGLHQARREIAEALLGPL